MYASLISIVVATSLARAQYCGVVTSPIKSYQDCEVDQFPTMDKECLAIGGTVAGHNRESGNQLANCITYCNNVPTGNHEYRGKTSPYHEDYHLLVVDKCDSCGYCGPPNN
jgi:hypothetical protein